MYNGFIIDIPQKLLSVQFQLERCHSSESLSPLMASPIPANHKIRHDAPTGQSPCCLRKTSFLVLRDLCIG